MNEVGYESIEFFDRFTPAERAAIRAQSASDPTTADILQSFGLAAVIVNTDPRVVAGIDYLVSVGLLTSGRATEILGNG